MKKYITPTLRVITFAPLLPQCGSIQTGISDKPATKPAQVKEQSLFGEEEETLSAQHAPWAW